MRIEPSVRGIFTVFFRQFWKTLFSFVLIVGGAGFYVTQATPIYESRGSILIKFGSDAQPDVSKNATGQPDMNQNDRRELIESYTKILQSHDLLASIIKEFGAEKMYPGLAYRVPSIPNGLAETAYERMSKGDLNVKADQQGNIIEIRLQNSNPQLAAAFSKRLLEQFITRQSEVFNKPETNFINEQVVHASEQLAAAQKTLQAFKAKNGLSSVEEEMNRLLQEKSEAKNIAIRSIDEAQTRVDELKAKETQLMLTYQENSPAVQKIRESLSMAERQLFARQADLKAGTIQGGSAIDRRMKLLEAQRGEYNDLARQVQIAEENYKNYMAKSEEARVKTTLNQQNITRISVLDEPTAPLKPVKPNVLFIMVVSLMAGFVLAIGVMLAFEGMDERFSKPEQITALLDVPVLASFTKMRKGWRKG